MNSKKVLFSVIILCGILCVAAVRSVGQYISYGEFANLLSNTAATSTNHINYLAKKITSVYFDNLDQVKQVVEFFQDLKRSERNDDVEFHLALTKFKGAFKNRLEKLRGHVFAVIDIDPLLSQVE